jgi:hypothetical protein
MLLLGVVAVALGGLYVLAQQEGYIIVETPGVHMHLKGPLGSGACLRSGTTSIGLLPRTYTPSSLRIEAEQDGRTWRLLSHGPWGDLTRIRIERGRTTTIAPGPPLRIEPQIEIRHGHVYVGLCLFGRAGERYAPVLNDGNQRMRRPTMRIIDEAGTVLASRAFEYG